MSRQFLYRTRTFAIISFSRGDTGASFKTVDLLSHKSKGCDAHESKPPTWLTEAHFLELFIITHTQYKMYT